MALLFAGSRSAGRCSCTRSPPPPSPRDYRRCAGRLRLGWRRIGACAAKSSARNSFHSVMIATASAPVDRSRRRRRSTRVRASASSPSSMPSGSKARMVAPRLQGRQDQPRLGAVAHVVGIGLEGEAEHGDGLAARRCRRARRIDPAAMALLRARSPPRPVSTICSGAPACGGPEQRQRVLGKAGAAIARARLEEFARRSGRRGRCRGRRPARRRRPSRTDRRSR